MEPHLQIGLRRAKGCWPKAATNAWTLSQYQFSSNPPLFIKRHLSKEKRAHHPALHFSTLNHQLIRFPAVRIGQEQRGWEPGKQRNNVIQRGAWRRSRELTSCGPFAATQERKWGEIHTQHSERLGDLCTVTSEVLGHPGNPGLRGYFHRGSSPSGTTCPGLSGIFNMRSIGNKVWGGVNSIFYRFP